MYLKGFFVNVHTNVENNKNVKTLSKITSYVDFLFPNIIRSVQTCTNNKRQSRGESGQSELVGGKRIKPPVPRGAEAAGGGETVALVRRSRRSEFAKQKNPNSTRLRSTTVVETRLTTSSSRATVIRPAATAGGFHRFKNIHYLSVEYPLPPPLLSKR